MSDISNVLVIGGGGREHAICWKLSQSPLIGTIFVTPGNVGIGRVPKVQNVSLDVGNHLGIVQWSHNNKIQMVIVGPEDPLANGIANVLNAEGMFLIFSILTFTLAMMSIAVLDELSIINSQYTVI